MNVDQSKMPLMQAINKHSKNDPISFHVPGHKNGILTGDPAHKGDLTELTGLDDLHDAEGPIAEAQALLSELYGSRSSYLLVNGSTSGNMAAILATCEPGDYVLVQRNCHKSVWNGIRLAGAVPVLLEAEWEEKGQSVRGVSLDTVQEALEAFPAAKACVLTYPTYYGFTYPIQEIIAELHGRGIPCIVDEAHGAHFQASNMFPDSALALGADIVIQSAHKMLPAMTMGSYLHLKGSRVDEHRLKEYLSMLQSSSPSYPIMASLDYARSYLGTMTPSDVDKGLADIAGFISELGRLHPGLRVERPDDPLKVLVRFSGWSGYRLQKRLEEEGIFAELADPNQVLLIFPLMKESAAFPYGEALRRIKGMLEGEPAGVERKETFIPPASSQSYSLLSMEWKEMKDREEEAVSLQSAAGRISSQMVIPYPPGIPLLLKGEPVTDDVIGRLKEYLDVGAAIQGRHELKENKIFVFKELEEQS
ncbi:aminotransferase class I/II-fold pyridoxal phosphate-dependent enzyme [Rossellomorea marisflavi]|uniref:aminotransferase class I/II-fold pyridoxal phosphate-dependent enzyme n=1 Tax=Rossellomorea marisflavi TaxID=189381 RepID=UPI0035182AD9